MGEAMQAQQVHCEIRIEGPEPVIHADPQQIEQVLINLVRNAVESLIGAADPQLQLVAASADFSRVRIQVIDNGAGIDPANLDNIFVPFFTTKRGGTGVGLSISRQLMHANRGFISYRPAKRAAVSSRCCCRREDAPAMEQIDPLPSGKLLTPVRPG